MRDFAPGASHHSSAATVTATATMALPSPGPINRPSYLDNVFRDGSDSLNKTPSQRSTQSSVSSNSSTEFRTFHSASRPLSPAFEEAGADQDDRSSIRSLKGSFSPKRGLRRMLNRHTYPTRVQEMVDVEFPSKKRWEPPSNPGWQQDPPPPRSAMRRPSFSRLQLQPSAMRLNAHIYATKPLPRVPGTTPTAKAAEELRCQPCYYFAARHCNGYVLGGQHGDACENCLVGLRQHRHIPFLFLVLC